MKTNRSKQSADLRPIFAWIAHRLRLLGEVSAKQAECAFGVKHRQFRRWVDAYNSQAVECGNPSAAPKPQPWGRTHLNPVFEAEPLDSQALQHAQNDARVRGDGDVFPINSDLTPNTPEALALLDALRAHSILARVAPNAHDGAHFMDEHGDPLVEEIGGAGHPRLDGDIIPVLLRALAMKRPVSLDYINKKGQRSYRVFSPHRFIFSQGRYHVRGYDENREKCLDINPARAISAILLDKSAPYYGPSHDMEWREMVTLKFRCLHSGEGEGKKLRTIRQTFPVNQDGILEIKVRKALTYYVKLHILNYALVNEDGGKVHAFELF